MVEHDPDSLEHVAGRIEAIHRHFLESKAKMTGVVGENPFGAIRHPDERPGEHPSEGMADALGSYRDGMHGQFDAAANLMLSTGGALREIARVMRETDNAAGDNIADKGRSLQQ
ncbi:hypothetical protein [Amycolatopsis pigmentata]|uniref:Excreted virulence factor EspC, type VII ESX diderm n=1 Tax=Amycolatopsis pigmentata TaxID=450801 RepID=A0ABW5FS77_9PSEU